MCLIQSANITENSPLQKKKKKIERQKAGVFVSNINLVSPRQLVKSEIYKFTQNARNKNKKIKYVKKQTKIKLNTAR